MGIRVLILGGDRRMVSAANAFCRDGFEVLSYGFSSDTHFDKGVSRPDSIAAAVDNADVIVTGLPLSADGVAFYTPLWDYTIRLGDVLPLIGQNKFLIGGRITPEVRATLDLFDISCADYLDREEFAVANAVPTAEGAMGIAIDKMPVTLWRANALVLGFGRIGKALSARLASLGANTFVSARKFSDLSWIDAYGYKGVTYDKLGDYLPGADVIFNTVPNLVLGKDELALIREDCIIIDLASAPGGVDTAEAVSHGIKVIPALALPGKIAPETAGRIIKETILNMLSEKGVR